MAGEPKQLQFSYTVTVGNVITILTLVVGLVIAQTQLTSAVNTLNDAVKPVPGLVTRVSILENRADTGKAARENLESRVNAQDVTLNQILNSLGRIEERIKAIQQQKSQGTSDAN